MNVDNLFTRQQALKISGLSSGQLSRLDAAGTIAPIKIGGKVKPGSKEHPCVLYTTEQIQELKLVAALRDRLTSSEIQRIIKSYRQSPEIIDCLLDKALILYGGDVYWVDRSDLGNKVERLVAENNGSATMKIVCLGEEGAIGEKSTIDQLKLGDRSVKNS